MFTNENALNMFLHCFSALLRSIFTECTYILCIVNKINDMFVKYPQHGRQHPYVDIQNVWITDWPHIKLQLEEIDVLNVETYLLQSGICHILYYYCRDADIYILTPVINHSMVVIHIFFSFFFTFEHSNLLSSVPKHLCVCIVLRIRHIIFIVHE